MAQGQVRGETDPQAPLVAFDFDGTLTVRDSYTSFLRWRAGTVRWWAGLLRLIPASVAYLLHRDRGRLKAAATAVFLKGVPRAQLEADALRFAETMARRLLRPDAVETWKRWRRDGDVRLVIVTASPDLVVEPFARGLGAGAIIGTRLAFDALDRATGAFATPNCRGEEKVARLREAFGPHLRLRAAYGDTSGDREMLEAAEEAGYRIFRGRP